MKFRLHFVVPCSLSFENRFQNFNTIYCNTTILYGCVANSIPYAVSDNLNPFHFRNDTNKKNKNVASEDSKANYTNVCYCQNGSFENCSFLIGTKKQNKNNAT